MDSESLDRAVRFAVYAAAGEIQREIAEAGALHVSEADLRRAIRSGTQAQLGPVVAAEVPTPRTSSWTGRIGGITGGLPTELFESGEHDVRGLLEQYDKHWR